MRCLISTLTKVTLLAMFAGLPMSGCSDDSGPIVYVDVSLAQGLAAPAKVELRVLPTHAQTPLATKTFAWPASGPLKAGVILPEGAAGMVTVKATGLSAMGATVAAGVSREDAISATFTIVLEAVVPGGPDAGSDASPPGDAGASDGAVDGPPGVDASGADRVTTDQATGDERPETDTPLPDDGRALDVAQDLGPEVMVDAPFALDAEAYPLDASLDVVDAARSWSTPAQLSPNAGGTPSLALDPVTGNALVVWADSAVGVMAATYNPATDAWAAAVNVIADANVGETKAAVDAKGRYVIVWTRNGPVTPTAGTWASFSSDGTAWSKPTQLFDAGEDGVGRDLRIAMNRQGQAMVTWDQYVIPEPDGQRHKLYAAYLDGTATKPAVLVASGKHPHSYGANVAIDGDGKGLIVWDDVGEAADAGDPPDAIWAATFAEQTVAKPAAIQTASDDYIGFPLVAMNEAGRGIVVWRKSISTASGSSKEFYGLRYSATGSWAASAEQVIRVNEVGERTALVLDGSGIASLAWSRASQLGWQVHVSMQYSTEGMWTTHTLETDNLASTAHVLLTDPQPTLALDGNGNLLAGWRKQVSDNDFVPTFRWRQGSQWGPVIQTGQTADLFSQEMSIGATDDGRAAAAWTYDHCDPIWTAYQDICPTAKPLAQIGLASRAAYRTVFAGTLR